MSEPNPPPVAGCALCDEAGGVLVWSGGGWRVVRVADADFPGFYRVIAEAHVAEFSDLGEEARARCMALVCAVESVLRQRLAPTKINLAALGNMVPHLHWHVVARFDWDSHFPQPIWGQRLRDVAGGAAVGLKLGLAELDGHVLQAVSAAAGSSPP